MTLLIITLAILYYIVTWMLYIYYSDDLYDMDLEGTAPMLSIFGLGIIWIIPFFMQKYIEQEKKDPYKIQILNRKVSDTHGVQFIKNNYNNATYAYYNFSDEDYAGMIDINIKEVDLKTMDIIVQKLNEWAADQNQKNSRMKAYSNTKL